MEFDFKSQSAVIKACIEKDPGQPDNDGCKVTVDDVVFNLSAGKISDNSAYISSDGHNIFCYFAENDKTVFVHLNGRVIELSKISDTGKKVSGDIGDFGSKDEITTPMPGKIVRILVNLGDMVAAKQPLVIVESMKMENEIKSPSAGKIKSVHFKNGDLVSPGQLIIKLEIGQ